jgi:mRNA-degrading endonuclease HigB of HigAB toxin-antitoxin module
MRANHVIVEINYHKSWVFVKFIDTHAQYDKIEAATINTFKPKKQI